MLRKVGIDGGSRYGAIKGFSTTTFQMTNGVRCRITTWALEEARRRLEAEGILEDPHPEKK